MTFNDQLKASANSTPLGSLETRLLDGPGVALCSSSLNHTDPAWDDKDQFLLRFINLQRYLRSRRSRALVELAVSVL